MMTIFLRGSQIVEIADGTMTSWDFGKLTILDPNFKRLAEFRSEDVAGCVFGPEPEKTTVTTHVAQAEEPNAEPGA